MTDSVTALHPLPRPKVCQCGCKAEFQPTSRNQKYRLECSKRVSRARRSNGYKTPTSAAKVQKGNVARHLAAHLDPDRRRVPMCLTCYNLPHVRPAAGCEECGFPHG